MKVFLSTAILAGVLSLSASTEVRAEDNTLVWTEESAFQALNLVDMGTTLDIKNHPNLREGNPLLGRHPSDGEIVGVKLTEGALHALLTHELLKHRAPAWLIQGEELIGVGIEGAAVGNNLSLGLHVRF